MYALWDKNLSVTESMQVLQISRAPSQMCIFTSSYLFIYSHFGVCIDSGDSQVGTEDKNLPLANSSESNSESKQQGYECA